MFDLQDDQQPRDIKIDTSGTIKNSQLIHISEDQEPEEIQDHTEYQDIEGQNQQEEIVDGQSDKQNSIDIVDSQNNQFEHGSEPPEVQTLDKEAL